MKSCPFCKKSIDDNSLYCPYCGNDVTIGNTNQKYNHLIIKKRNIPNVYRRNIRLYIFNIFLYVGAFLFGFFVLDKCGSEDPKDSEIALQMPVGDQTNSTENENLTLNQKEDLNKNEKNFAKENETVYKKVELICVSGIDSLFAELLDETFPSYKLYLKSSDGGFYLDKMPDVDFEYVTQYFVIGNDVHFVAGKDGYGRGMTNYYFVFNVETWSLKKIAEGHRIKFVEGRAEVIDFDGNKSYYDLL